MRTREISRDRIEEIALQLLDYCKRNEWAGYDPYDALNSRLFESVPLLHFKFLRLAMTQLLKRSPINIRPLLLIPKTQNPKAIALFLMAFLKLKKLWLLQDDKLIGQMIDKLIELRSPPDLIHSRNATNSTNSMNSTDSINPTNSINSSNPNNSKNPKNWYWCWGYSFPWQTRAMLVPRWAPNLVCTSFVGNALFDVYEREGDGRCLEMGIGAAEYILEELFWEGDNGSAGLAYPHPLSRTRVHNANFLGAAMLCRAYKVSEDKKFLEPALKVSRYSIQKQNEDGSWYYGEHPSQRWIDNFHTGYNLCALHAVYQYSMTSEFETYVRRGLEFYKRYFFEEDGIPRYFHDRSCPIDVHSVAQSIITLLTLRNLDEGNEKLAQSVFGWAMSYLWDRKGYYYYQKLPYYTIRIPYIRWSQAWMLYALANFLEHSQSV